MNDRLVRRKLFDNVLVNATGAVESAILDVRWSERAEALMFQAASASGTADVKFEYAISPDGTAFGSYDDEADILASSAALTNPEGWHTVPMPNMLTPFVKIQVKGVASNPADTRVTAYMMHREGY